MTKERLFAALLAGAAAGGIAVKVGAAKGYEKGYEVGYREGNQWGQQEGRRRTLRELESRYQRRETGAQRAEDSEKRIKELLAIIAKIDPNHPVLKS